MKEFEEGSPLWYQKRPKQRAKLYVEFIYELIEEFPNVEKNEVAKEIHRKLMMLPDYWDNGYGDALIMAMVLDEE